MNEVFDSSSLPAQRVVDYASLSAAESEEPFVHEAFELLKDSAVLITAVAGLRTSAQAGGLPRNHAIIVGHYARMIKLMKSLVRQVSDGHGGDQQIAINREFLDSVSTVAYLLGDPGDGSRYEAYVMDSLIAEREFLKDVRLQIAERGEVMLPIEERIERSIQDTLNAAGVREEDIPGRGKNGWPSAQTRINLLGPTAYAAYRTGSSAVHGTFSEIYKHHLESVDGGFEIELRPQLWRPQPLLAMALLALISLDQYSHTCIGQPLPEDLDARIRTLVVTLQRVDSLHEEYPNRSRATESGASNAQ